jgi:hypothetical protein
MIIKKPISRNDVSLQPRHDSTLTKKLGLEAHVCPRVGVSIFMKNLQIEVSDPMWICVFANYYRMVNISSTFALTENKTLDIS